MAGRIPQSFLDTLLDRVDIVDVIDRRVKLKKTGKNYSARCPFHDEKTPSFSVNPDKQFFYCFGCGAGGNAIGFLMDYDNVEFPQAVETLAAAAGLDVPREAGPGAQQAREAESASKPLYALMEKVSDYYQQQLRQHDQREGAIAYLKGRGLTGEVARDFKLGFAPPGWDNLLKALGDSDDQRQLLIKSGMLVENEQGRVYDRFRDRVMFPIRDRRGRVIAFGGRVLGDDKPKYLNSPETDIFQKSRELYGLYEARKNSRQLSKLVVVEGYMDVIALAQHGITYACATLGTATSRTHLERSYRLCPEVVFCFDGDEAGRKAAVRALEAALPSMEDGRQAKFLFLPDGQDPDDVVRAGGSDHFEALLEQAVPLEEFLFEHAAQGLDISSLDGRARMSKLALPLLRQLPEGVYRELMFQALAQRTGLELSSLMQFEVPAEPDTAHTAYPDDGARHSSGSDVSPDSSLGLPPGPPPNQDYDPPPPDYHGDEGFAPQEPHLDSADPHSAAHTALVHRTIALLLHRPNIALLAQPQALESLEGKDSALLRELLELLLRRPQSTTAMLLGHWHGTSEGKLLNRLADQERLIPSSGIEAEFRDAVARLTADVPRNLKLARQVDKLRETDYASLSDLEKQQLLEMLQEKAQRDARRGKLDT